MKNLDQSAGMALASLAYRGSTTGMPAGWTFVDVAKIPPSGQPPLGAGWNEQQNGSGKVENRFEVFVNETEKRIVFSFKGSDVAANFASDLIDNGSREYFKIESKAQAVLNAIAANPGFRDFTVSTAGHSLGGGMAQSFALKNNLDTQVYNSLPVAAATIRRDSYWGDGGYEAAVARYLASGRVVQDVRTPNDIASYFYGRDSAGDYLANRTGQTPTVLPGISMPDAAKTALLATALPFGLATFGIDHTMGAMFDAGNGLAVDPVTGRFLIPDGHADFASMPADVRARSAQLNPSPVTRVRQESADAWVVDRADGSRQWVRVDPQTGDALIQQDNTWGGTTTLTTNARDRASTCVTQWDHDGQTIAAADRPDHGGVEAGVASRAVMPIDGETKRTSGDADRNTGPALGPALAANHVPAPIDVLGSVHGMLSLMQAIESGDGRSIAIAASSMLSRVDGLTGGALLPDGSGTGMSVIASTLGLLDATRRGDGAGIAASGTNLAGRAVDIYADLVRQQAVAEGGGAGVRLASYADDLGQTAGSLALAGSLASLAMAIDDGNPYRIASAALSTVGAGLAAAGYSCPPLGLAAAAVAVAGILLTNDDLPTAEGEAAAIWAPDGGIDVVTTVDREQGGATPASLLESLVGTMRQALEADVGVDGKPRHALIPQRIPALGYACDPDSYSGNFARFEGGAPGHLYLQWIDDNGNPQRRYFDSQGSRNQAGQLSLAQEFMLRAGTAIVPAWEAATVLSAMTAAGAIAAPSGGTVEENRARVARQLGNRDWQLPDRHAGMPQEDADGLVQTFTVLTVDLAPPGPGSSPGGAAGRIGRNVDLDPYVEQTDWVHPHQGILSIDTDGNGVIDQREMLTTDADAAAGHARNSLRWLDANGDGRLDAQDPAFRALGIWRDANGNGQTDEGEFVPLSDRGIVSIEFASGPPSLRGVDGARLPVAVQRLTADVRGDHYRAAFVDADGDGAADTFAGVLHRREQGETVLQAVVTHDYSGEDGHTRGGEPVQDARGELHIDAADPRIRAASHYRPGRTLAEAFIATGDIRVSSAEPRRTIREVTRTAVGIGDVRLSPGAAGGVVPGSAEVATIGRNDPRLVALPPATAPDAFAAMRAAWAKAAKGPFGGIGALTAVAIGAVAEPVAAAAVDSGEPVDSRNVAVPASLAGTAAAGVDFRAAASRPRPPALPGDTLSPADTEPMPAPSDAPRRDAAPSGAGNDSPTPRLPPTEPVIRPHGTASASAASAIVPAAEGSTAPTSGAVSDPEPADDRPTPKISGEDVRLVAPDVVGEEGVSPEDRRYCIDASAILANDTTRNAVPGPLSLTQVFGAEHGTVEMLSGADGSLQVAFTPDPDYWGPACFRYVVSDPYGLQSVGRVALHIAPVNDAPIARDDSASGDEDTEIVLMASALLANDDDVDTPTVGDMLRIVAVSDARNGVATLDAQGNVRFLTDRNYFGPASFAYWASDGAGGMASATVALRIQPVNDAPVAAGETLAADEDTVMLIDPAALLDNDWDIDNPHEDLSVISVRDGQHGTVSLTSDGQVRFVPEADFHGTATFRYTVADGSGGCNEAIATVELAPVNDAPRVTGERYQGREDEAVEFSSASLLQNDIDVDDPWSSLTLTDVGNAKNGQVWLHAGDTGGARRSGGFVAFVPDADYFGPASFEYTVADPHGAWATGRVDIELAPVNDAPRLKDDDIDGDEDTALTIAPGALLANDSDVDNPHDALHVTGVGNASHGVVSRNADGTIRFVPDADFFGEAAFAYEVSDGAGGVSTAMATIHVAPVNDAPVANDNVVDGRKDVAVTITAAALLADDYDVDNPHASLHVVGVGAAGHGTVRLNADTSVTFQPQPGYGGFAGARGSFAYTIADGAGGFATATTIVNLETVNTNPTVVDDGFSGYENVPFVIAQSQLLANDSDADGDPLSVAQVDNALHGAVKIQPDGQIRFDPDPGFHGRAAFRYLAADPYGGQAWATAFLDVAHVNQAPIVEAVEYGRPVFGYHHGPEPQIGHVAVLGERNGWIKYPSGNGRRGTRYLQPVYDAELAVQLSQRGGSDGLRDATGNGRIALQFYRNGSPRPMAFDHADGVVGSANGSNDPGDRDITYFIGDDPTRQSGRIVVCDPDGDSRAVSWTVVGSGPQHGHVWLDQYGDPLSGLPMDSGNGTYRIGAGGHVHGETVAGRYFWYYESHRGDPYNGPDPFTIRITDGQGGIADAVITPTHKGTHANGGFSPLVLDLDGNGPTLLAAGTANVEADVNGDGKKEPIGWAAPSDGVLGFDSDGNGTITIDETRLTAFAAGSRTDLDALAAFDSNGDGRFSAEDDGWSRFFVVQDRDGDGRFASTEHRTLADLGIVSIGLDRQGPPRMENGNVVFGSATATYRDGATSQIADVMFAGQGVALPEWAVELASRGPGALSSSRSLSPGPADPPGPSGTMLPHVAAKDDIAIGAMAPSLLDGFEPGGLPGDTTSFLPVREDAWIDVIAQASQAAQAAASCTAFAASGAFLP